MSANDLTDAIFRLTNDMLYKLLNTLPNVGQLGEKSLEVKVKVKFKFIRIAQYQ